MPTVVSCIVSSPADRQRDEGLAELLADVAEVEDISFNVLRADFLIVFRRGPCVIPPPPSHGPPATALLETLKEMISFSAGSRIRPSGFSPACTRSICRFSMRRNMTMPRSDWLRYSSERS